MMRNCRPFRQWRWLSPLALALLSGCQGGVLDPKGPVAADEKSLIIMATLLMLLVVVPVIVLTLVFAWRYRAGNEKATYAPKWAHSTKIEAVVWLIPCIIIVFLGTLTWYTTHALDPYRPLVSDKKPVKIEAVAMNWKWLFIYPDLGIATVNQIAFPKNVPVDFVITSDTVTNAFFIPQLAGQVYAMAGMETQLHLIADHAGSYHGLSSNYSGAGFSGMKFTAIATETPAEFDNWVKGVRAKGAALDPAAYRALSLPSENNPVAYFSSTTPKMFEAIVNKYMAGRPSLALTDDEVRLDALTGSLCVVPPAPRSTK